MAGTPAVEVAERAAVPFSLHAYEHEQGADSFGLEAAAKLGVDPARVFKTLVLTVDGALAVACVPVASRLAPRSIGKRAELAEARRAEAATGYAVGGISPLGQRRRLPTHIDSSALAHATVFVSAGRRGLQIELDPNDLVALTDAQVHEIAG